MAPTDVHYWIIAHVERFAAAPDAPAEIRLLGPGRMLVVATIDWFEGEDPLGIHRGVDVAVMIGDVASDFAYAVAPGGEVSIVALLPAADLPVIEAAIRQDPDARLRRPGLEA